MRLRKRDRSSATKDQQQQQTADDENFDCDTCSKRLSSQQALQRHQVTHTNRKPHKCSLCPKAFKRIDSLQYHQRTQHTEFKTEKERGDKPFIARQCRTCLEENLTYHQLVWSMRHGEPRREHQCLLCLSITKYCRVHRRHEREHRFEQPDVWKGMDLDQVAKSRGHQCQTCYKLLTCTKTLKRHRCVAVPEEMQRSISTAHGYPTVSYLPKMNEGKTRCHYYYY